uniref:Retrotransposon Copia-like N-terminal domain-containing protein n=1 Tax=Brassica oleracea var. oleracea TaxID=109376 RepID=A0A0D3A4D9_BRAOL
MPISYANAVNNTPTSASNPQTAVPCSEPMASIQDLNSNPLYVHHADHAGIALVSEKLAGLGNFNTWRRSMLMALGTQNKLSLLMEPFRNCLMIIRTLHLARQRWLDIHDQFKQSDGPRNAEFKQQIFAEVQGSQSVSDYYTKLMQLWEELKNHDSPYTCCCNRPDCSSLKRILQRDEQDKILKFLTGLNDTFTSTKAQILMMEPRPNIAKVFNLVSQEEMQRSMKSTSNVAFSVSQNTTPADNVVAAYNAGYPKNKSRPICSHCGIAGHTIQRCYKLHGYPQGYKQSQNYNARAQGCLLGDSRI